MSYNSGTLSLMVDRTAIINSAVLAAECLFFHMLECPIRFSQEARKSVRRFFHWQYSQFFIGLLAAVGFVMVQLHRFIPAYICILAAGLWAVAYWICSDKVYGKYRAYEKFKEKAENKPDNKNAVGLSNHARSQYFVTKWGGIIVLAVVTLSCFGYLRVEQVDYELSLLYGRLYPANDPDPPHSCPLDENEISIYEGKYAAKIDIDELPVGLVHAYKHHVMDVDKSNDGSLILLADIRDRDNKLIVRFDHEGFQVNPNNYFQMKRPDRSTLVVLDQYGTEVINARYLNKRILRVWAHFFAYGTPIDLSSASVGGAGFEGICVALAPSSHNHPDLSIFGVE